MRKKISFFSSLILLPFLEISCNQPGDQNGCYSGKFLGVHCDRVIIQIDESNGEGIRWTSNGKVYENCVATTALLDLPLPQDSIIFLMFEKNAASKVLSNASQCESLPVVDITYVADHPCYQIRNVDVPLNEMPVSNNQSATNFPLVRL
ncbi:hypothetical protein [Dyadobacter sp. CY326]|uniref:hypothetical protein n=1 Tax=Dyadobacter sp. CY326 TaxID=2907300 RepID=UPI001F3E94EF|nr:hypothetical protein [Dyadobacter sp. CY326]MCE7066994.1 hypothetical protein [Dyadobacter sp. CY326]